MLDWFVELTNDQARCQKLNSKNKLVASGVVAYALLMLCSSPYLKNPSFSQFKRGAEMYISYASPYVQMAKKQKGLSLRSTSRCQA